MRLIFPLLQQLNQNINLGFHADDQVLFTKKFRTDTQMNNSKSFLKNCMEYTHRKIYTYTKTYFLNYWSLPKYMNTSRHDNCSIQPPVICFLFACFILNLFHHQSFFTVLKRLLSNILPRIHYAWFDKSHATRVRKRKHGNHATGVFVDSITSKLQLLRQFRAIDSVMDIQ